MKSFVIKKKTNQSQTVVQFILILKSNIYLHYTHGNIIQDARFLFVF